MSGHVEAARQLIGAGRTDLAQRELRAALAENPDDGAAHSLRSLCLTTDGHHAEALAASDAALRLLPENSFLWRVRSVVFLNLGRAGDAESAAQHAIEIDPGIAHGFVARGQARLLAGLRAEALADFDTALSLDPKSAFAHDLRTRTLTLLGRNEEAAGAAAEALRLAPESASAHAARAWQLLHAGDRAAAQTAFREALRLDPQSNSARLGLVEALKARNPVYRLLLRGLLGMGRIGRRQAVALFAVFAAARVAGIITLKDGGSGPYVAAAVAAVYLALVVAVTARPLFNALLRLTPDGRDLLSESECRESALVLACISGGVLFAASWALTGDGALGLAGAATALLSLLVVGALRMRGRRRRIVWALGAASVLVMLAGLGVALAVDGGRLPAPSYVPLAIAAPALAAFGSSWTNRVPRTAAVRRWRGRARPRRAAPEPASTPPVSRWVTWPLTGIGVFAGMGLLGSLHSGARMGGAVVSTLGFVAAVAVPAARPVVRRARVASGMRTLMLLGTLAALTMGCGAAAAATRRVPVEGGFALALFLLVACALVIDADSRARRRRLASWVGACAFLVVGCGAAAVLGGQTHGPDSALTGPLAAWAGVGLFGLLVTPVLARVRSPRRLLTRA